MAVSLLPVSLLPLPLVQLNDRVEQLRMCWAATNVLDRKDEYLGETQIGERNAGEGPVFDSNHLNQFLQFL